MSILSWTAAVHHVSTSPSHVVFRITLANEGEEKFLLTIGDSYGIPLFKEVYRDKNFSKLFLVSKDAELTQLTFTISSLKDKDAQSFVVNTTTRIVENYDIRKL